VPHNEDELRYKTITYDIDGDNYQGNLLDISQHWCSTVSSNKSYVSQRRKKRHFIERSL